MALSLLTRQTRAAGDSALNKTGMLYQSEQDGMSELKRANTHTKEM